MLSRMKLGKKYKMIEAEILVIKKSLQGNLSQEGCWDQNGFIGGQE